MIVVWRLSNLCNLGCQFCAYDRNLARPRLEIDSQQVLRFGEVLSDYAQTMQQRVLLSWLGGEPFLWPPLFDVSRALHRKGTLRISATTNGTTLHNAATRHFVLEAFAQLTISVDGFAGLHDTLRQWPEGWKRLKVAVKALNEERREAASPLVLRANVVLMRDNVDQFAELCMELANWGCDEITFNQLGGRDRPEFFIKHRLSTQDVDRFRGDFARVRMLLATRNVKLCGGDAYVDRIAASSRGEVRVVDRCAPDEPFLFIDEQGVIAPCHFTVNEYGVHVDDIQSVDDLVALTSRWEHAKRMYPTKHCADCHSTQAFAKFA